MYYCPKCREPLNNADKFCPQCGTPKDVLDLEKDPRTGTASESSPPPYGPAFEEPPPPQYSKYAPVSTWGFVGVTLLMMIPFAGFIVTIVWACGACQKINLRNYARAVLIIYVLLIIISILLTILMMIGVEMDPTWSDYMTM